MEDELLIIIDERGVQHRITSRNLRSGYKGRLAKCDCGELLSINNPPLVCAICQKRPTLLMLRKIDWWDQPALEQSSVLVIGCGAVGNEVVKNLAMMGVSEFTLVDFDELKKHNISRSVLFNHASMKNSATKYKTDVMKAGIKVLNPNVKVNTLRAGVLDDISRQKKNILSAKHGLDKATLAKKMKWPNVLEKQDLIELAKTHDLCIVATDGVAPKAYISQAIYPYIPIIQGAMNATGSTVALRLSLPLVTSCIMCPTELDPVEFNEDGLATKYIENLRQKTGSGGCDTFIEAAGAASFTDSTSFIGAAMASQSILILMGWQSYLESEYSIWPIGIPIWDEVLLLSPRNPAISSTHKIPIIRDAVGDPVCVTGCSHFSTLAALESKVSNIWDKPRVQAVETGADGVEKPGSKRRSLGS